MSCISFSTDSADYFLVYANHYIHTDEEIFQQPKIESLDAIILESNYGPDDVHRKQYQKIIDNIISSKTRIPLYALDVGVTSGGMLATVSSTTLYTAAGFLLYISGANNLKKRVNRREFLKGGLKILLGTAFLGGTGQFFNGAVKGKPIPVLPELSTALQYLPPTPMRELRNAITARKTEEFVAPNLKKEKGRKPLIALVYGAMHSGIETDLKHKSLRDAVIKSYKSIDYSGIKKERLNVIYEIDLKRDKVTKHIVDLF